MEASTKTPILVDFWAAWCGPCKQLTPLLEQAVQKEKGRIHLAKIDVDANPAFAGQLQIRSLPTVFAFWQGQPVHRFSGLVAPGQLQMLVDQLVKLADQTAAQDEARDGNIEKALENAEQLSATRQIPQSQSIGGYDPRPAERPRTRPLPQNRAVHPDTELERTGELPGEPGRVQSPQARYPAGSGAREIAGASSGAEKA